MFEHRDDTRKSAGEDGCGSQVGRPEAFVPTSGMPGPVRWFAEHQPVTSIVDTLRNLYAGQPVGSDIWTALAWCVGLLVLAYALAMRVYHRTIA
jgi:ABC-2 type transport system permease protein